MSSSRRSATLQSSSTSPTPSNKENSRRRTTSSGTAMASSSSRRSNGRPTGGDDEHEQVLRGFKEGQDAYDPDQDREEKRRIRKEYRALIEGAEGHSKDLSNVTTEDLTEALTQANTLYAKVRAPQEATLDSRFLIVQSEMGAAKARSMRVEVDAFDVNDWISKLVRLAGGRGAELGSADEDEDDRRGGRGGPKLDWGVLGDLAARRTRRAPAMDFMLGPLAVEQKQRTQAAKRSKLEKNVAAKTAPQQLNEDDIQRAENETTKNVTEISRLLEMHGGENGINLFRFIINPEHFDQSVENLFYLSFLIRDGKASLVPDEHTAEPMLMACEAPSELDYKEGLQKQQAVFELDMDTWQTAIDTLQLHKSVIATREKLSYATTFNAQPGNRWHG